MNDLILKMKSIEKSFPGVKAVCDVDFDLHTGEVHALMGENGAGKSTLMKCLAGINPMDSGEIFVSGKKVEIRHVRDAFDLGIAFIHQELAIAEQLTVAENIYMGREPQKKSKFIDRKKLYEKSTKLLERVNANFSAYNRAYELSTAQKQVIEIAKALSQDAKIIVMDEPTAALTQKEVDNLFSLIASLKEQNITIVYISHRMEEIFQISDRITVLRDGIKIGTLIAKEANTGQLIKMMVGHELDEYYARTKHAIGDVVLEVKNVSRKDKKVIDASFILKEKEILGFSGIVGAGRTELMQILFGIEKPDEGEILINGKKVLIKTPVDALNHGIGLVPEDRKLLGLILKNTVAFNISIGVLKEFIKALTVNRKKEQRIVQEYIKKLNIKITSQQQIVINLSGGNQQKVVLSKWLAINSKILILDEPTRGIDVGAKAEIYSIINKLAEQGISIIIVSSEMPELMNMCDRIYVMNSGKIKACLEKDEINQEKILTYALGVE